MCARCSCTEYAFAKRVAERKRDAHSIWLGRLKLRGGPSVAAVTLADKNARVM
jgi:hypothetical protein